MMDLIQSVNLVTIPVLLVLLLPVVLLVPEVELTNHPANVPVHMVLMMMVLMLPVYHVT